jgi:hypothetical protein
MVDLNMHPINEPQVLVANAGEKFDANLRLTDRPSRKDLKDTPVALLEWARRLQTGLIPPGQIQLQTRRGPE